MRNNVSQLSQFQCFWAGMNYARAAAGLAEMLYGEARDAWHHWQDGERLPEGADHALKV